MQPTRIVQILAAAAIVLAGLVMAPALADVLTAQRNALDAAPSAEPAPVGEVDIAAYVGLLPSGVSFVDVFVQ